MSGRLRSDDNQSKPHAKLELMPARALASLGVQRLCTGYNVLAFSMLM
jgi:hypothetical protein